MRKSWCVILAALLSLPLFGEMTADSIVGIYKCDYGREKSKIRIYRLDDGGYQAQCIWLSDIIGKDGMPRLDVKNPDKSLRNVRCDRVILVNRVSYVSDNKWGDGKIYDPTRGIRVDCTMAFEEDGKTLKVRGSLFGIGMSVRWVKIE